MSDDTRQRIIQVGAEIMHRKGFQGTGLKEILDAAAIPKGSFYHYFRSKEDFGLAVIEYFNQYLGGIALAAINEPDLTPAQKLERFLSVFRNYFLEQGCTKGCPIGNFAQEMGDLSEAFRTKLDQSIDAMAEVFASLIREGQQSGDFRADMDPKETGYFMVASWHGAMIRMKVSKSIAPLDLCHSYFFTYLLAEPKR